MGIINRNSMNAQYRSYDSQKVKYLNEYQRDYKACPVGIQKHIDPQKEKYQFSIKNPAKI